jgi:enoyl-CoA hydratase/carnithine racemase
MGFVFSARGLIPEGCASYFLPRLVRISKALPEFIPWWENQEF